MTKEKLEKEADKWLRKYLLCNNCKKKCTCIQLNAYCEEQVLKAYLAGAEPREKRIAELEQKLEQTEKDLADYQFNYPTIKELEAQIEKMKCDVLSLVKDGMNNDIDQNIIERLAEKWEIKEND